MSNRTSPCRFVKNVMQNGIGRHVCQLQRITLSFCKENNSSRGVRDFIENYLLDFTKANPGIVVYVKPKRHRRPYLQADYFPLAKVTSSCLLEWACTASGHFLTLMIRLELRTYNLYHHKFDTDISHMFDMDSCIRYPENVSGYSEKINLGGLKQEVVCEWLGQVRGRSGVQVQRLMKDWHTDTPSVQGVWHPFMFKDTSLSVADFRDKSLHEFKPLKKSATDKLLKLQSEQAKQEEASDTEITRNIKMAASG